MEFIAGVLSVCRVGLVRDEWGYHLDIRIGQYWGHVGQRWGCHGYVRVRFHGLILFWFRFGFFKYDSLAMVLIPPEWVKGFPEWKVTGVVF